LSFCSSNVSSASRWRPKTVTMACPVCISSTCPLSVPVMAHWAANCFCERLAIMTVTTTEAGTARREMRASNGLMRTIMTSTPTTVRTEVMSWVRLCWRVWPMLSMSLVTRLSVSPRAWLSKYFSGSRPIFSSTSRRRR
jgi:hypothetical protein